MFAEFWTISIFAASTHESPTTTKGGMHMYLHSGIHLLAEIGIPLSGDRRAPTTPFTEYTVHQQTQHQMNSTLVATASMYESLNEVSWNIMIPADLHTTQTRTVIANFHVHTEVTQEDDDEPETFWDYIKMLPKHIQWLLMHVEFVLGREQMLKHCLANSKILKIGTDSSFNMRIETASFGWLLIGNQTVLVWGAGPVDGIPTVISSRKVLGTDG